ncbi:MAG: biotin/lipoyl-binding protein, partial [Betaproteobacteria bacterium]|nr:biotin/lipoyl-binding protein [Betaproteobacteria bacterium]
MLQPIRGRWAIVVAQRFGSRHRQEGPAPKGLKLVWVLFRDTFRYDPSGRERLSTQLIFVILLAALSIGTWSVVMEIDQVINADAKVISSAKLQTIEHFEGGRIERIHVKAGDAVKPGDLLLTLSPLQAQNEFTVSNQQSALLQIRAARIEAELQGRQSFTLPAGVAASYADTLRTETSLLRERQAQLASGIRQRQAEIASIEAKLKAAIAGQDAIEQERVITARLVERGLEPRISLVRIERAIAEAQGAIAQAQEEIGKSKASIETLRDEYRSNLVAELAKVQSELVASRASVSLTKDKLDRSLLRSPTQG